MYIFRYICCCFYVLKVEAEVKLVLVSEEEKFQKWPLGGVTL